MSRQSVRKVKLTSKFEEFSTSRLASIQRLAHPPDTSSANQEAPVEAPPAKPEKQVVTPKIEREPPRIIETPKAPEPLTHPPPVKERTPHKILRQKAASITPIPASSYEIHGPSPYSHMTPLPKLTANGKIRGRPRKCWQKAETVVKPISSAREELMRLREENANLRSQLEQRGVEYEDLKRQSSYTGQTVPKGDYEDLKEKYNRDIANAKRHEWCVVCLNPSRYHCCWNTTYCSQKCQVADWYQRHMKSCERRKALDKTLQ